MSAIVAQPPFISRREWRRVILFAAIVMLVTALPYLLGALLNTPEHIFGGLLIGLEDQYSYVAKMVQGAQGEWLFHLPYTSTPHPGIFLYSFYLVLGKFGAIFGLSHVGLYHVARVVLGFVCLLVIYRFIAEFVASPAVRFLALALSTLAGGPGWIAFLLGQPTILSSLPLEFIVPEGFTFLMLYTLPHLLLARALLLLGAIGVWRAGQSRSIKLALGAGGLWLIMSIVQPIYSAVVLAIAALMFLSRAIVQRRPDWMQARAGIIAGALAVPMVVYVVLVFNSDPTFKPWSQTPITSPGPALYLLSYGIPVILAIGGLAYVLRRRRHNAELIFITLWTLIGPLLVYAPTNAQRRLVESWQIPLSILAAYGLVRFMLLPLRRLHARRAWRYSRRKLERGLITLLIVLLMPTYIIMVVWHIGTLVTRWPTLYQSSSLTATTDWLTQHATYADGVLAAYNTGTIVPARAPVRVMLGHPSETVYVDLRKDEVKRFFDPTTSDEWRRALLTRLNLNYVWHGPEERALGAYNPARSSFLRHVFSAGDVQLYEVEP
jgi:hypothetical protein